MFTAIMFAAAAAISAIPTTDPGIWLTPDDYPKSLLSADREGRLAVELGVDEKGMPTGCTITTSSGDSELDTLTCDLLVKRAKFKPAIGPDKRAGKSTFRQTVRWQIPREKLITQGFRVSFDVSNSETLTNCKLEKFALEDDDLQCDPQGIAAMAAHMLPAPLDRYKSVALMLGMEVEQGITLARKDGDDRVTLLRASVDISPAGIISGCTPDVTPSRDGKTLDLCKGPVVIGEKAFEPDPDGKGRRAIVSMEISGTRK